MAIDFLSVPIEFSSLDSVSYQYFNQLLNHRTIILNEDIDETFIEKVYIPLRDFEKDDSTDPITLIINCNGGSVSDSFFFAHYLTTFTKPLNIIICGYAASMATIILAAGGKNSNITRFCYPSSYAMLHDGSIEIPMVEAKTANDIVAFQDKINEDIRNFIIEQTNITPEQYDAHSRHQWFISAKEMKELNLVDKIIGVDD